MHTIRLYLDLIRFNRPIGTLLLFYPCLWGLLLSLQGGAFPVGMALLFLVGAFLLRSAGCIINDWWDRDIDRQVERTRNRPLASGALGTKAALWLLSGLLLCGLLVLLQFNKASILLGFAAMPLVVLYPLAKRFFFLPQLVLGIVFNWGALLAPVALLGTVPAVCLWLYAGCVFWTLYYDTLYAVQDRDDDKNIGIQSSARVFERGFLAYVPLLFAVLSAFCLMQALPQPLRFPPLVSLGLMLWYGWRGIRQPALAGLVFRRQGWIGLVITLEIVVNVVTFTSNGIP